MFKHGLLGSEEVKMSLIGFFGDLVIKNERDLPASESSNFYHLGTNRYILNTLGLKEF